MKKMIPRTMGGVELGSTLPTVTGTHPVTGYPETSHPCPRCFDTGAIERPYIGDMVATTYCVCPIGKWSEGLDIKLGGKE